MGSKKPFRTHETIFWNTEFDVFSTQKMAPIEQKFERKRIDPINDQITDYFNQIIAHWSLIDRVIGSENERDLSNPDFKSVNIFLKSPINTIIERSIPIR